MRNALCFNNACDFCFYDVSGKSIVRGICKHKQPNNCSSGMLCWGEESNLVIPLPLQLIPRCVDHTAWRLTQKDIWNCLIKVCVHKPFANALSRQNYHYSDFEFHAHWHQMPSEIIIMGFIINLRKLRTWLARSSFCCCIIVHPLAWSRKSFKSFIFCFAVREKEGREEGCSFFCVLFEVFYVPLERIWYNVECQGLFNLFFPLHVTLYDWF